MDFSELLQDATSISNFAILIGSILYIARYFISKKYHKDVDTNLELIDSILDMGIDKATQTESKIRVLGHKIKFLFQKFGWIKKDPIDTVPIPPPKTDVHSIPFDMVQFQTRLETMMVEKMDEMTAIVDNHVINTGAAISAVQLEFNHLVDKVQKAVPNLDYNNGDDGELDLDKDEENINRTSTDFIIHEDIKKDPTFEECREEARRRITEATGLSDSGIHPIIDEKEELKEDIIELQNIKGEIFVVPTEDEDDPNELTEYEKSLLAEDD